EGLQILSGSPDGMATSVLAARGIAAAAISRLARRGYISVRHDRVDRDPFAVPAGDLRPRQEPPSPRRLTEEQEAALGRLRPLAGAGECRVALLHGVTGSGKTEIYLRLAAAVRGRGHRVLILVPEIALTPAMAAAFRYAFGDRVAIQHSGLSDGERHDQWQRIRRGDIDVVVGTRSAVFAPLEQVGLIVVDEEHDGSYKQEESPRYNGRDVAIVRGRQAGALVVLGSATPSMESYHNAMTGKYERIVLARRVLDRALAAVTVVDMREEYAAEGPDVILSRALRHGLRARGARGASRRSCSSSAAALRPPCSAGSAPARSIARTAACHWSSTAMVTPGGRAATTAITPRACRLPVRCAPARTSSRRDSEPNAS